MSAYECWVTDFPKRCKELLANLSPCAKAHDREVTLLLAVASVCIAVPLDRMTEESDGRPAHPSGDRGADPNRAKKFDDLLKSKVRDLQLWNDLGDRFIGCCKLKNHEGDPDSWPELDNPECLGPDKQLKTVLKHVRNALAHGNLYTQDNPISRIVLLSRPDHNIEKYNYLVLQPDQLAAILKYWIDELVKLEPSAQDIAQALE